MGAAGDGQYDALRRAELEKAELVQQLEQTQVRGRVGDARQAYGHGRPR